MQRGVKKIMGGQILDYEAKRIRDAERVNTERERKRADEAEQRADEEKQRADEAEQRARRTAYNLFKNGVSYEMVRTSVEGVSDAELQEIYKEVCGE